MNRNPKKKQTLSPKKPQRQKGRPRGTLKKYKFEQTRLGFALKYECPAVFEVLERIERYSGRDAPSILLIEVVFKSSNDISLRKPKFIRYLEEYRKKGLKCNRAQILTPRRERYYSDIRRKKLQKIR